MRPDYTIVIPRRGINDQGKGKKHALHRLISEAQTEYVHLMDDDVVPPLAVPDTDADLIILPLRMESSNAHPTLIEELQIAEYDAIQSLTVRSAQRGHAVMCSGANMIVRRDKWLESYADLHSEMPSGDDMFLLESFKRRGLRIDVTDAPEYEAVVRPQPTLLALFRQRMRWAGKAPAFRDQDIRYCGIIVVAANLLQVFCPPVLLIKFPVEYHLIRSRQQARVAQKPALVQGQSSYPQSPFLVILLLEVLYPFYMLICLIGGVFRRYIQKESPSF
ncbi:MAG: glycosyltransferase [Paludibacteraceae bacterium]|nr:glycosyltransferase [Paludibacteraceae bacterium]